MDKLKSFWTDESGQTLAEYAILLALIAIVVIVTLRLLGPTLRNTFQFINDEMEGVLEGT